VDHEEAAEVAAVGVEEAHVHALDPAGALQPAEHRDPLLEDLDRPLLATAYGGAEPDEQRSVCHRNSLRR
jgi:hypothetical protein